MTTITIITGNAGPGLSLAAAATALHVAAPNQRTLVLSTHSAAGLHAAFGELPGAVPAEIAPNLDAFAIDGPGALATAWEGARAQLPSGLAQIAGDELPLLPGAELLLGLAELRRLAPRYAHAVLDVGAHDMLLRTLSAPDALRWVVRLLFGLDRGPGRSTASINRALLPTTFIPTDAYAGVQNARVRAEQLREEILAPGTAVRFVLRPDPAALEEARIAVAALQLHGLPVAALLVGPLLPDDTGHPALEAVAAQQTRVLGDAAAAWPAIPLRRFRLHSGGAGELAEIGAQLGTVAPTAPPIATTWQGAPALAIALPGLPKGALQLTLSGDELIVRVGAYRRHLLLPEALRGVADIRATREGEHLVVRRR